MAETKNRTRSAGSAGKKGSGGASRRGFAAMSEEKQREIASKGGRAAHALGKAHRFTTEEAREAGRKGGVTVSRNREHMADIGRKGGETVSRDRTHMSRIGRKGGSAGGSEETSGRRSLPQAA